MKKWWMIRAGDNNELIPTWKEKGIASIGWPKLGNPKEYLTRDALRKKAEEVYSTEKPGRQINWANQVWRFSKEIEIGDRVVTYLKERREYLVGTVTGAHFMTWWETVITLIILGLVGKSQLLKEINFHRRQKIVWGQYLQYLG